MSFGGRGDPDDADLTPASSAGTAETLPRPRTNGILYFRDRSIFLSELLIGQLIALEEIADGVWSIYFYGLLLARLDERTWTMSG